MEYVCASAKQQISLSPLSFLSVSADQAVALTALGYSLSL